MSDRRIILDIPVSPESLGRADGILLLVAAARAHRALNRPVFGKDEPIALWAWFYLPRPKTLPKSVLYPVRSFDVETLSLLLATTVAHAGLIHAASNIIDYFPRKRFADGFDPHALLIIDRFEAAEQIERGAA